MTRYRDNKMSTGTDIEIVKADDTAGVAVAVVGRLVRMVDCR